MGLRSGRRNRLNSPSRSPPSARPRRDEVLRSSVQFFYLFSPSRPSTFAGPLVPSPVSCILYSVSYIRASSFEIRNSSAVSPSRVHLRRTPRPISCLLYSVFRLLHSSFELRDSKFPCRSSILNSHSHSFRPFRSSVQFFYLFSPSRPSTFAGPLVPSPVSCILYSVSTFELRAPRFEIRAVSRSPVPPSPDPSSHLLSPVFRIPSPTFELRASRF